MYAYVCICQRVGGFICTIFLFLLFRLPLSSPLGFGLVDSGIQNQPVLSSMSEREVRVRSSLSGWAQSQSVRSAPADLDLGFHFAAQGRLGRRECLQADVPVTNQLDLLLIGLCFVRFHVLQEVAMSGGVLLVGVRELG